MLALRKRINFIVLATLQRPAFSFARISSRFFSSAMEQKFKDLEVVPDVLTTPPQQLAKVLYNDGVEVNLGNVLTPTQVKDAPKVTWDADQNSHYTLCMTDPDAPSRKEPTFREWHHWLVTNIPGNQIEKGETLSAYIGAGPPPGTGLHRYILLVYKQSQGVVDFSKEPRLTNTSAAKREKFHIEEFAKKYNLGNAIAGNFFQAEYDDYVPKLYQQLGEA